MWVGQNDQKNICFQSESDTWTDPYLKTELHARALPKKLEDVSIDNESEF